MLQHGLLIVLHVQSLFHLYAHQPYFPPIKLPHPSCSPSFTVGVAVTVVSGVLLLIAVSSVCLRVFVTGDASKQKTAYSLRLSVSSTLKFNQPSIAPLYADKVHLFIL